MLDLARGTSRLITCPGKTPGDRKRRRRLHRPALRRLSARAEYFGPIGFTPQEVTEQSPALRKVADTSLVGALRLKRKPACRRRTDPQQPPPRFAGEFAEAPLPPGGEVRRRPGRASPPSACAASPTRRPELRTVRVGKGGWVEIEIPTDAAEVPWQLVVDGAVRAARAELDPLALADHQELLAEQPPGERRPQVDPGQRPRGRQYAAEGVGQVAGDRPLGLEAGRVEVLLDRQVGEGDDVVGEVPVFAEQ